LHQEDITPDQAREIDRLLRSAPGKQQKVSQSTSCTHALIALYLKPISSNSREAVSCS
jgi:hypothetical protein